MSTATSFQAPAVRVQVAVVTGASRGIGREVAHELARASIVNISSVAARTGGSVGAHYAASKAGEMLGAVAPTAEGRKRLRAPGSWWPRRRTT